MRWLALLALWLACAGAEAQVLLSKQPSRIDLWPHVRVLADRDRAMTLEQALAAAGKFEQPRSAYATLGMAKEAVWLRIPFRVGAGGEGPWILDIDYTLLRRLDVYAVFDGYPVRSVVLGVEAPFRDRPMKGRTHATPLSFPPGATGDVFIRVDTQGAKILPITLSRLPEFHAAALKEQLLQGGLGALGLFLLVFSIAQWLQLRENLYLKYAFLVACSAIFSVHFFGIGEMYLWTGNTWFQTRFAGVASLLAAAATALFVEDALAGDLGPWLRRGLRAVVGINVAAAFAHATGLIDIQAVAILMSTTGLAPSLLGIPGALARMRRGDPVGAWFIAAWIGYFIAAAVMVGVVRGTIDANFWTLHSFQFGTTFDMLVFVRIATLQTAARLLERKRLRDSFSGYVSPALMDEILAGRLSPQTSGEQRHVCVMFSDLRGYTARGESMQPAELLAFLNRYFDGVVGIVHQHGGTVVCFMGDGIEAVFGAPQAMANPSQSAFEAAKAMLAHVESVNGELAQEGKALIDIGIGLHCGEAVVGHIGGRARHEYAAIGDVTNVAARLEVHTKEAGYPLLVSEDVAARLESREGLRPLGPISLKGHTPVEALGYSPSSGTPLASSRA